MVDIQDNTSVGNTIVIVGIVGKAGGAGSVVGALANICGRDFPGPQGSCREGPELRGLQLVGVFAWPLVWHHVLLDWVKR